MSNRIGYATALLTSQMTNRSCMYTVLLLRKLNLKGNQVQIKQTETRMSKRKIFINTSDVAAFIGQNKWDTVTPFERLWKKCDADSYDNILEEVSIDVEHKRTQSKVLEQEMKNLQDELDAKTITKRQYTLKHNKLQEQHKHIEIQLEQTTDRIDDIKLTQAQKLEKMVGSNVIQQMSSNSMETFDKRKVLDTAIESLQLSKDKLRNVKKECESFLNKTHGTLKEDSAIQMYEDKFKVRLDTSQKLNKLLLKAPSSSSVFDWYICGKVDGLYIHEDDVSKNYIVEVKNRTKSFFSTLRDYEKTQIHLYMHMLGIPKSKLVEKLESTIRITEIYEDKSYTNDILEYLGVFIACFENSFLAKADVKAAYVVKSTDDKKQYIQQKFITPVLNYMTKKISNEEDKGECMIDDLD